MEEGLLNWLPFSQFWEKGLGDEGKFGICTRGLIMGESFKTIGRI
ncbi:hypothetical protein GXM_03290 [Nostoc sphaeroides CCNUC1]|uniref:Uncharacterized protein n=1 Tax=Nostoc sphaeroides CCNUC1 TaxID=2653204 RepID=A0A5P8VZE1_9NOSO|nr:hypothetical protein GXM_03290 [Nostoc sphaeroides CCNUC1]